MRSRSRQIAVTWCRPVRRMRRGAVGDGSADIARGRLDGPHQRTRIPAPPERRLNSGGSRRSRRRARAGATVSTARARRRRGAAAAASVATASGAGEHERVRAVAGEVLADRDLEAGDGAERRGAGQQHAAWPPSSPQTPSTIAARAHSSTSGKLPHGGARRASRAARGRRSARGAGAAARGLRGAGGARRARAAARSRACGCDDPCAVLVLGRIRAGSAAGRG